MKIIFVCFTAFVASQTLQCQISVQSKVNEPNLIGCHWQPKTNQICLYQSATDKDYYFFQFTNVKYARINEIATVGFNANKEELELLFETALDVYVTGNTVSLKVGEHDLLLIKEKWLSFSFSKKGEVDSFFMVNEKQLKKLFGK
jgi:hypothetical protein